MPLPLFIVDAFTDRPFAGNPAAVCLLSEMRADEWLQQVAAEMNLSETAFLLPEQDGYRLRWFTPGVEVALCGHATLASAHALWEMGRLERTRPARFYTRSGLLTVDCGADGMTMDFPSKPAERCQDLSDLPRLLGVEANFLGKNGMDCLVDAGSEEAVRAARPDFARLGDFPVRGIIVTARSNNSAYDFVSRFFAPRAGVNEDPVTGSAHCCLGPYWAERLQKRDLIGWQASARGGSVRVGVRGERVLLGGQAVTVMRGELCA